MKKINSKQTDRLFIEEYLNESIEIARSQNNYIDQILKEGGTKAHDISSKKVKKIKEIVGF